MCCWHVWWVELGADHACWAGSGQNAGIQHQASKGQLYCRIYCRVATPAKNVSASKAWLVLLVGGTCWVLWLQMVLHCEVVLSAAVQWGVVNPIPCFCGLKVE